jgi:monoamine oxidase
MSSSKPSVVVVGAGIAGLAAAAAIAREHVQVTVVEARARIGGRIDTRRGFAGATIELGAEFVHGRQPDLIRLVDEAGAHLEERPFRMMSLKDGRDVTPSQSWDRLFEEIASPDARDIPMARHIEDLLASGKWNDQEASRLRAYVEGYMAGDVERISARAVSEESRAASEIEDEHNASVVEGYDVLASRLQGEIERCGGSIVLDRPVTSVHWTKGSVRVEARPKTTIVADCAIVTVPLGVLHLREGEEGAIRFDPPIEHSLAAARRLGMGAVVKIFLRLDRPLASMDGLDDAVREKLRGATFLRTPDEPVPTWWITGPADAPTMVGWVGGPSADRLSGRGEETLVAAAIDVLSRALAISREKLGAFVVAATAADWKQDPWARGAYSWIPAGALDAPAELAAPIDDTLFFAGEATDTAGYRGTVHGALVSGLRAASEVLATLPGGASGSAHGSGVLVHG